MSRARTTLLTVESAISGRNISIDSYSGTLLTKSQFSCLVCGFKWSTSANNVMRGSGCPNCASNILTIDELREALVNRDIEVILYSGSVAYKKSIFKCTIDGHVWEAKASLILKGSKCPKCAKRIFNTKSYFVEKLTERGIFLEKFADSIKGISEFRCLKEGCGKSWKTSLNSVVNSGSGCPFCVKVASRKNINDVLLALQGREIELLNYSGKTKDKSEFLCLKHGCGHIWKAQTGSVLSGSGCPSCTKSGFKEGVAAEFYAYKITLDCVDLLGFGITNKPQVRHSHHRGNFNKFGAVGEIILSAMLDGKTARIVERKIKKSLSIVKTKIPGFKTECVAYSEKNFAFIKKILGEFI